MPVRVSQNGALRFNRTFNLGALGRLRVTRASGVYGDWNDASAKNRRQVREDFSYRNGLLTKLYRAGRYETLLAFQHRKLDIGELIAADQDERLGAVSSDLVGYKKLWSTWEATIPEMTTDKGRRISAATQACYLQAMNRLRTLLKVEKLDSDDVQVVDLKRVNWTRLFEQWGESPASWNHMARGLSRFLTIVLGDKFHPLRRQIVGRIPRATEVARRSTMSVKDFYRVLDMVPERWRPPFAVLAVTGLRIGELCAADESWLDHSAATITVKRSKTHSGLRVVPVAPAFWPYIVAAIPVRVTHWYLRKIWAGAVDRAFPGRDIRLHDLRHFVAQVMANSKVPESQAQAMLGHAHPDQTRAYAMEAAKGEVAQRIASALPGLVMSNADARKMLLKAIPGGLGRATADRRPGRM